MRILMPGRILEREVGGNTTYTRQIAERLRRQGHEVKAMPYAKSAPLTAVFETMVGLASTKRSADILHYTADTGPFLGTRLPTLVTVHGIASRHTQVARTSAQDRVWRKRVQHAIDAADRVITVSKSSANDIEAEFSIDPSRLSVIPHGIDHIGSTSGEVSSRVHELIDGAPFLLYLGNIEPRKNLDQLVEAVGFDLHAPRLVIAGRPAWNFESTMAQIAEAPNVTYLGYVSDAERAILLERCLLFLFPSHYEGFGLPVLEAMSHGAPVLCSNRGSLAEVGGPAFRLDSLHSRDIRRRIDEVLADDAALAEAREAGPAWSSRYTWASSALAHEQLYKELLAI